MPIACPSCNAANDDAAESCFTCGHILQATLRRGSLVAGRYDIQAQLGKGGMGVVYRAHDRLLDETVAIKVLRPEVARDPEISRRFQSEIKLARKVSHRNVCRIHEYGEDAGGLRYISMELLEGVDLRQVLRQQGGLPAEEAFRTALQIAEGLQAIHEMGIIHRDLKTPNIMRDARGTVRLMDFGIAKEWGAATSATATGLVMGTPEYMSPEQARGEKIDFRSDVYALGIIVYELFTGRVPFRAETPLATILKHLQEPPPLHGPEAAALPEAVKPILGRALAKHASERYPTVQEMAEALREAQRAPARAAFPTVGMEAVTAAATAAALEPAPPVSEPQTLSATAATAVPTQAGPPPTQPGSAMRTERLIAPPAPVARTAVRSHAPTAAPRGPRAGPGAIGLAIGGGVVLVTVLTGVLAWRLVQRSGPAPAPAPPVSMASSPAVAVQSGLEQVPVNIPSQPVPTPATTPSRPPQPGVRVASTEPIRTADARSAAPVVREAVPPPAQTALPSPAPPVTPTVPAAVQELMDRLSGPDTNGRWRAAEALGNMGGQAGPSVPALTRLLRDGNEVVCWRAAEALGKIGPDARAAVPALVAALGERPGLVSAEAAKALGRIGAAAGEAVPALATALRGGEIYTRREAAKALVKLGSESSGAVPSLIDALRDKDKVVRMEAARALGRIGPEARAAAPALATAARDPDDLVARTASQALELVQK